MKSPLEPRILKRLKRGTLTHIQAWNLFGTYRLAIYISRLRRKGHNILTIDVKDKRYHYAKYKLQS